MPLSASRRRRLESSLTKTSSDPGGRGGSGSSIGRADSRTRGASNATPTQLVPPTPPPRRMTDGTRPETSAFIGLHYQPAAEADRPDFYPTVLDLVISFFQDEWIEIPYVGGGGGGGMFGGKVGGGGLGVLLLMIHSVVFLPRRWPDGCFCWSRKVVFFLNEISHQVSFRGRYRVVLLYSRLVLVSSPLYKSCLGLGGIFTLPRVGLGLGRFEAFDQDQSRLSEHCNDR